MEILNVTMNLNLPNRYYTSSYMILFDKQPIEIMELANAIKCDENKIFVFNFWTKSKDDMPDYSCMFDWNIDHVVIPEFIGDRENPGVFAAKYVGEIINQPFV